MNDKDDFQILRDERTKLVNRIADLETENAQLREAECRYCRRKIEVTNNRRFVRHNAKNGRQCFNSEGRYTKAV
jgi:hypothetical protein